MELDFRIIKVLKSAFKLLAHFQEFTKHIRVKILVVLYLSIFTDLGDCIIGARFFHATAPMQLPLITYVVKIFLLLIFMLRVLK